MSSIQIKVTSSVYPTGFVFFPGDVLIWVITGDCKHIKSINDRKTFWNFFFLHQTIQGYEDTPTDYCKNQAVFDAGAVPSVFFFKNTVGLVIPCNLSSSTYVNSIPHPQNFSLYRKPRLYMFPLPTNTYQLMWLLLILVVNPVINQWNK